MKSKRFIFSIAALLFSMLGYSQTKEGSCTIKINESGTISLGMTYNRILRNSATGISYRWYSSNTSKATVSYSSYSSCTVRGKAEGTCKVYFEASFYIDGFYRTYSFYWDVTVSGYTGGGSSVVEPTRAEIRPSELSLYVGETYTMSYSVYPLNATYTKEWVIYSTNIATIDASGKVTAKSPGTAIIYLWVFDSKGGNTYDLVPTSTLTVMAKKITAILPESSSIELERGESRQLSYTITPTDATTKVLAFESSDNDIASVDANGLVTGHSRGDCIIKATTTDGSNLSVQWDIRITATSVLDETATDIPLAKDDVDVTVNRTIKANEWNTICLPFAMSSVQVGEAFGQDVQIGEFNGCSLSDGSDAGTISIDLNFIEATSLEANHPYIIKVSSDITQFAVEHVNLAPAASPMIEREGFVRAGQMTYDQFIGSYVANVIVPENALVLSGNKLWKSNGKTKMKALRGYFVLHDVMNNNDQSEVKLSLSFIGNQDADVIDKNSFSHQPTRIPIYTIDGRQLGLSNQGDYVRKLAKGIYIVNGKKIILK